VQVMHAAEQALRQLQVSDVERNAILEAFRYEEKHLDEANQRVCPALRDPGYTSFCYKSIIKPGETSYI